jgi:hypothetical protein
MRGPLPPSQAAMRRGERATWGGQPDAEPARAERPGMRLRNWRPMRKGSLLGFAAISLPGGLEIDDVPVLATHGRAWATLPARPVITADGRVAKIPGTTKSQYVTFLRWRDRALSTAFSERVVELIRREHPADFDSEGAP